ncbi:MAG: sorbosone dehydrogenase family protein [Cytophagaceae bacterium]|nr:sorbosone dehydrogenase family protein [Cytophagaceae bacterium]
MKPTQFGWSVGSFALFTLLTACQPKPAQTGSETSVAVTNDTLTLPAPFATESAKNFSNVIGWPSGKMPTAPAGFEVSEFAGDLRNPRWVYVLANGDVLVAESQTEKKGVKKIAAKVTGQAKSGAEGESANRITLLRDSNGDGKPDVREVFLQDLNQPFGMLVVGNTFYVANTDGVMTFPYQNGQTKITATGKKILELPAGGYNNHWTRNLLANADGSKIYVSVGSGSNVGENGMEYEVRRANILEINPDGSGERIFASGLRNPVGMDWAPGTMGNSKPTLWVAVNERDELGDDLVPDYITGVKEGAFYGWPYAYYGPNEDPRREGERPDLVQKTMAPDVPLGAHTASLGLAFYTDRAFPEKYRNGAFVGQHGSWNRSTLSGYKVVFVPFKDGKPAGKPEDFLTGFVANTDSREVYGRPVGIFRVADGSMLVTDDSGGKIWRVRATGSAAQQ